MNPATTSSLIARFTRRLGLLALACTTTLAHAQAGADLPRSTVETISVNPAQRTQIQQFVDNWAPRVTTANAQENKRAVEALTQPLQSQGVSVAFRQTYAQLLKGLLDQLGSSDSISAKLSELRLSSELATPTAVARILKHMNDADAGVRLFAISRAGHVFETTRVHGPAMTGNDINTLINAIAEAGAKNANQPEITRACARSLAQGAMLGSKDLGDARSRAIIALSDLVGERLQALTPNDDPAFAQSLALDAASATTRAISDISATVTPEAARAAIRLGGDIISVPLRRLLAKTLEEQTKRDVTVRSVQAGETLLYFARRKAAELAGTSLSEIVTTQFSKQLESGDDRAFRNDAAALLGPGSPVVRESNVKSDRFLR